MLGLDSIGTGDPYQDALDWIRPTLTRAEVVYPSSKIIPPEREDWEDTEKYLEDKI